MKSQREVFQYDLARFNASLEALGAVMTLPDGSMGIDPTKVPEPLLRAYISLQQYGYANGLVT